MIRMHNLVFFLSFKRKMTIFKSHASQVLTLLMKNVYVKEVTKGKEKEKIKVLQAFFFFLTSIYYIVVLRFYKDSIIGSSIYSVDPKFGGVLILPFFLFHFALF